LRSFEKRIKLFSNTKTTLASAVFCFGYGLFLRAEVAAVVEHFSADDEDAEGRVGDFHLDFGQFCEKIRRNIRRI
jgi:hypothetical protein